MSSIRESFRLVGLSVWILILGLAPATRAVAENAPAAVLAVASGEVTVIRGEERIDGSFGAALLAGDVVETGADAEAAVFFETGQMIQLGPGSRISVSSVPDAEGGDAMAQLDDVFTGELGSFTRTTGSAEGLAGLPTLRSGAESDRPSPIRPRNTRVAPGTAGLYWVPVEDVLEYRVTVTDPEGAETTHRATDASMDAATWFDRSGRWQWRVEAVTGEGESLASETVWVEVVDETAWSQEQRVRSRLEPMLDSGDAVRADAARYLIGTHSAKQGYFSDAIVHLETLADRHPDRRELQQELGNLYRAVGRNAKAADAYRLALQE